MINVPTGRIPQMPFENRIVTEWESIHIGGNRSEGAAEHSGCLSALFL